MGGHLLPAGRQGASGVWWGGCVHPGSHCHFWYGGVAVLCRDPVLVSSGPHCLGLVSHVGMGLSEGRDVWLCAHHLKLGWC